MPFTNAQTAAINERNCSLIVSAGAGSGKTAVLTERIVGRICDESDVCNITDFIIVTFTKAAAKEMSDRIRRKLSERACLDISNKKILRNLSLLSIAKISTIDSFCFDLVKSNFQKLGLSASLRMMDETEAQVIKSRIMNEVVDDAFSENDGQPGDDFILTYEIFSGSKSDSSFVSTLLELYTNLGCCASKEDFIESVLARYDEVIESEEFFETAQGRLIKEYAAETAESCREKLSKAYELCLDGDLLESKYAPSVEADLRQVESIILQIPKGYEAARESILGFKKERLGAIRGYEDAARQAFVKNAKNYAGDCVLKVLSPLFNADGRTVSLCAQDTKRVLSELFRLINEFSQRYASYKKPLGIIDFSDCSHYALELLTDSVNPLIPSELAKRMRRQYKEIYIDEYQDVNELQDTIFLALSATDENGIENSRFMVGDIKQSIYGFRGARPDIFDRYRRIFDEVQSESSRKRIYMSNNFRCSESVIDFTNLLFTRLMNGSYGEGDALIYSRSEENKTNDKAKLILVDISEIPTEQAPDKAALEAREIGKRILSVVNNPEKLSSEGKMYTFADVAVLTRSKTVHEAYERVFLDMGIPVFADAGEKFYSRKEIKLLLCILNSIDNPERDIYVTGFLRSCIGGFTDDELCRIKHGREKMRIYRALTKYAEENEGKNDALCEKCRGFIEKLSRYRALSRSRSASELVWEVYTDTDLLNLCASPRFGVKTVQEGENARKNLIKLYNIAVNFTGTSFHGTGDFLEYINACKQKDDTKADRILSEKAVQLMTIHRSKGLEFPVCFVSDTAHGFNRDDEKAPLLFSFSHGAATYLRDMKSLTCQTGGTGNIIINTPFRQLLIQRMHRAMLEEEMRTLYVALTRARDLLFITACVRGFDANDLLMQEYEENVLSGNNVKCYLDAILRCISHSDVIKEYAREQASELIDDGFSDCLEVFITKAQQECEDTEASYEKTEAEAAQAYSEDEKLLAKLIRNDEFIYENRFMTRVPSKLTVSMLKTGLLDDEQTDTGGVRDLRTSPSFLEGGTALTAAEKGTAMHMFMQFADYARCETDCESEADRLYEKGFIDRRQREVIDTKKLQGFFSSEFYGRIKRSRGIYRERRFNILVDASEYAAQAPKGSGKVLIQGVIDLYFENDDGTFTVVDFKTDRVRETDGEQMLFERHGKQLKYYCRAVSEITGMSVREAYLYSFALMREIPVEVE